VIKAKTRLINTTNMYRAGIARGYGMDVRRWNAGRGEIFRTRTYRSCSPPSHLCNGYKVSLLGVKRPGRGIDNLQPSSAKVKERAEHSHYHHGIL
jgi:hypothetical protein